MAAYPIYQPQFGIYNPNNFSKQPTSGDALTVDTAKLYFLQFPNAQTSQTEYLHSIGVGSDATFNGIVTFNETVTYNQDIEFLANVLVDGTATVTGNLLCDSTATVTDILTCEGGIDISTLGTGITFPDLSVQTTAFVDANYAQKNENNIFEAGFTNTFNGTVNLNGVTNGVTAPLGDNSTLLATTQFVIDNSDPAPILTNYAQKTLATLQTFTGPITFEQSPLALGLSLSNNSLNYLIQPRTNYGLTVINSAGNGTLALSNGGSNVASITCTGSQNFDFNGATLEDIPSINIGSQTVYANFSTNQANGITTLSNNNVGGGFTFNINGSIPTICDMFASGFYIFNTLNMSNNNIIGIGAIAGNAGSGVQCNSPFTMGTSNNINMNANNITGIGILTGTGLGDITVNSGLNFSTGSGINMGLGSIINCNSITDTTGQFVTTNTPPDNTNNTTIATTAFVKANAGIYTQTSITASSSTYYYLSPTTVSVISTYTSANNIVSFNSVQFNIVIGASIPLFLMAQLNFSATPFPGSPPPTGQTITMYCSNGSMYAGTINWINATSFYIFPPSGISLSSGMTFTVNLASLGAFTA